jgi:hypothetical protein
MNKKQIKYLLGVSFISLLAIQGCSSSSSSGSSAGSAVASNSGSNASTDASTTTTNSNYFDEKIASKEIMPLSVSSFKGVDQSDSVSGDSTISKGEYSDLAEPTITLQKNANGKLDVVLNNSSFSLDEGNNGITSTTHEILYYSHDGDRNISKLKHVETVGTEHVKALNYFADGSSASSDVETESLLFIVGNETDAGNVNAAGVGQATATYTGKVFIEGTSAAIPKNESNDYNRDAKIHADIELDANFSTAKISGQLSNIQSANGNLAVSSGTVGLAETSITGNGYSGNLEQSTLALSDGKQVRIDSTSTYEGKFFGTAAEETGGVLDIKGEILNETNGELTGHGVYTAKR